MGRTLVKAISDIKGFALAGVLEDTRSPLIGWDAGTLAGTPENGVKLTGDAAALIDKADGIVDFTALTNCPRSALPQAEDDAVGEQALWHWLLEAPRPAGV